MRTDTPLYEPLTARVPLDMVTPAKGLFGSCWRAWLWQGRMCEALFAEGDEAVIAVLFDGQLDVHYGFGFINDRDEETPDLDESRTGQSNGLLGAAVPGGLSLMFGLHTGPEPLRVEWSESAPPLDDSWEDVVEASVEFSTTELLLSAFEEFIDLALPGSGSHRVRFSATGMDAARDMDSRGESEAAPDKYLLQFWPAPAAGDAVIKQSSQIAAYWHRVARGEAD